MEDDLRAMRIVMLAPFGLRPKGTLLARMLPLAQALTRRGHSVTIVAPPVHNPEDADTRVTYGGVPVVHTARPRLPGPAAALEQSLTMLRHAMGERPELLHLFKPRGFGGLAVLAAPGVPLVVDADDWEGYGGWNELLPYPSYVKQIFAWQERHLPRRAAAVTVASRTLESLVWAMGVAPERVFYLPNGIDAQQLAAARPATAAPDAAPKLILYTRFWELDLLELAAALAAIHLRRPDVRLIVVGRGERGEEHELRARAYAAGFAAMLDERGWLDPARIPSVLAEATIALAPARDTLINRARCSAKLLELLGAGLAVVAGDVGEARTFIEHERNGLLTPPGNPGALAAAVLRLLDDPALCARLAVAARDTAARFVWDRLAPVAERAYALALQRDGR